MPKNRIRFQQGMSLREFTARYGTSEPCAAALFPWRWPRGFVCPKCGHDGYWRLKSRPLLQYRGYQHQSSVTAGTVLAGSKLTLTV